MSAYSRGSPQPCFSDGGTEVLLAPLDMCADAVQQLAAVLSPAERERVRRFRFERDRARFIVARARLRELLAERLGMRPDCIELVYGRSGKPALAQTLQHADWHFNLAHCD